MTGFSTQASMARYPHRGHTAHRFVATALCAVVIVMALWGGNAQAQIVFRETFGSTTTTLPTALSTADGNYLNVCLNGQIVNTAPDAASDGAASTHYLFHNTANCTYSGAWAVWRTLSAVPVEPDKTYVFSYWTMVVNQSPAPSLGQVVIPDAGTITVVNTVNTPYTGINNRWIRRMLVFTTSATTTSVNLRIRNGNTGASGNDFGVDDVMLAVMPTVTLNKTTRFAAGGAFGFGLTNTSQATGTVSTTAVDVPTQVDGDTASPGTTEPFLVAALDTDVVITESSLPSGWVLSDATCTSGGLTVGNRSGSSYTIPGSVVDGGAESFICNFTNTPPTNLRIDKTAAPTTVRSGDTVTYAIMINNDGPGPGDGAVVTDPAIPGVDCSTGTLTCGSAAGGAVCPASPTVAGLQGAGLIIPVLPMGGLLQFALTCTVTASGSP